MTDAQMWELFFEIHKGIPREGPGDSESTFKAYSFLGDLPNSPKILDIGCGPGMQTLDLAHAGNGIITAIDNHIPFILDLQTKIEQKELSQRVKAIEADMFNLPFEENSFDVIWAEGSIYSIGFERGLKEWKSKLASHGYLAVTEVSWLKPDTPKELLDFWEQEYPDIKTIEQNLDIIQDTGYDIITHFTLPDSTWLENYYIPLEKNIVQKLDQYKNEADKYNFFLSQQYEIDIFRKYSNFYGYVFYIMQK